MKAFNKHIFAFLGPTVICLSLGLILPLLSLFIMSFTNLELGFSQESFSFIGLTNYSNLIHNESTWKSISVTILFVLITVSIETVIGLILALFMAEKISPAIPELKYNPIFSTGLKRYPKSREKVVDLFDFVSPKEFVST